MKCSKCGFEYREGRNCPKCGENAILIHDEYFIRKKEWEEKNAPKAQEEENEKKVFLTPEIKKKIVKISILLLVTFLLISGLVYCVREYIRTHRYQIGFGPGENWVFSVNGIFAYEMQDVFSGILLEAENKYCSENGKVAAMTAYDASRGKYVLYISKESQSFLAYESESPFSIVLVENNGTVLLLEMEYGEFGSVTDSRVVEVGETIKFLSDEKASFVDTGEEGMYCIKEGDKLTFMDGKNKKSLYVTGAESVVSTQQGVFYLLQEGLYDENHELVDQGVKQIFHVYGTSELVYRKADKVVLVENTGKKIPFTISGDIDADNLTIWIRHGSVIYGWSKEQTVQFSRFNGKVSLLEKERPFLNAK